MKLVCDGKTARLGQNVKIEINKINEPDQREIRSSSDHFENIGLTSMKVKVSLFSQQKSQDESIYRDGAGFLHQKFLKNKNTQAPKEKKILLTCYARNDPMATKTWIGMEPL